MCLKQLDLTGNVYRNSEKQLRFDELLCSAAG